MYLRLIPGWRELWRDEAVRDPSGACFIMGLVYNVPLVAWIFMAAYVLHRWGGQTWLAFLPAAAAVVIFMVGLVDGLALQDFGWRERWRRGMFIRDSMYARPCDKPCWWARTTDREATDGSTQD